MDPFTSDEAMGEMARLLPPLPPGERPPAIGVTSVFEYTVERVELLELYAGVMQVVGTFLGLASTGYGSAVGVTLKAMHGSAKHLYKAAKSVSLVSLSHMKSERLFAAMAAPLPIPGDGLYIGYIDAETMQYLDLPVLTCFMKVIEATIERDCVELWHQICKAKSDSLNKAIEQSEIVRESLECEYTEFHQKLVEFKRDHDSRAADVITKITSMKAVPTPLDFECDLWEPPFSAEQVFAAAFIILAPADTYSEDPPWDVILTTVLQPSLDRFSYRILAPHVKNVIFTPERAALLIDLTNTISRAAVAKNGSQALDALFSWLLAGVEYVKVLNEMRPVQERIRRHNDKLENWCNHVERYNQALQHTHGRVSDIGAAHDEVRVDEPEAVRPDPNDVRRRVVDTIEGWHDYDTAAEVLTTEMITRLFNECDVDKNGYLDEGELLLMDGCLERFGVPQDSRLDELIATYSTQKGLTLDAFAMFMLRIAAR